MIGRVPLLAAAILLATLPFRVQAQADSDSAVVAHVVPLPPAPSIGDVLYFPVLFGFRIPSYDRSDGFSLRWGPQLALPDDRLVVDPILTYRSNLGHFDPSLSATGAITPTTSVHLLAQRATFSNDGWSVADIVNSASVGLDGEDGLNYYRGDRLQSTFDFHSASNTAPTIFDLYAGARWEFDYSVGPQLGAPHQVWTIVDHSDTTGILRPNPLIDRGHIAAAIAGGSVEWDGDAGAVTSATLDIEAPWTTPHNTQFVQITFDGHTALPAIGDQKLTFDAHVVVTAGDTAPMQRYAYVGGSNTLPTRNMLDEGGDELVYGSFMYVVPLHHPVVPLLGAPSIALRYVAGAAGVHQLPTLTQNVGPRLMLSILRVEYLIDPRTHQHALSFGATLTSGALDAL